MKYFQWVTGGNGGLLPLKPAQYLPALDAQGRDYSRATSSRLALLRWTGRRKSFWWAK
jgi:hypothetical protein